MELAKLASCVAILGLAAFICAADKVNDPQAKPATKANRAAAAKALKPASAQVLALRKEAKAITAKIGEITSKEDLTTSDESVKALQDLVQQLAKINEQLKKMDERISGIEGWIEGQNESLPVLTGDVDQLKRVSWGNYVQFQWQDTQEGVDSKSKGLTTNDGFQMRRFRISTTNKIDDKTSMKLAFDVAAGSQRESAELKEAMLMYDVVPGTEKVGIQLIAGQAPIPVGSDNLRSSNEREFPEYTLYNRTLFNGESGRGAYVKYGLGAHSYAHAGVWNNLTYNDPQQTDANTYRNLNGTHVAYSGGLRYYGNHFDVGISGFAGDRPSVASKTTTTWTDANNNGAIDSGEVKNVVSPAAAGATRQFLYLDGVYAGFLVPQLTLRAEYMTGKDRVPTLSSGVPKFLAQTDVEGYVGQATYSLSPRNLLSARYEWFDPNTHASADATGIFGLAYTHFLNPNVKLTLSQEFVKQQGFNQRDDVTTIRLQYRF
jgi:hypothetical protein